MKSSFIKKALEQISFGDRFIKKNGILKFANESKRLLQDAHLHELFDFNELVSFSLSKKFPKDQNFKSFEFSDLPVTIARGENCFIDIYFWRRRPTTIHNHHFVGAFQCLSGNNVDCAYSFKPIKKHTRFHVEGKLELKRERMIQRGDVESIYLQDKFIHQNHHQSDLTVNLCFRTNDLAGKNLSNFLYSGIKLEKPQHEIKRMERLFAFVMVEDCHLSNMALSLEDAFHFVHLCENRGSVHPAVLRLRDLLLKKIKKEAKLDLLSAFENHEAELDRMINLYE